MSTRSPPGGPCPPALHRALLEVNHVPVHQAEIIDDPGPPVQEAQTMDDLGPAPDDELPVSKRGRGIRQNRSLSPPSSEEGNTEVLLKGKKN
ncbi:hypothetical protein KEM48_004315 [Puccinia striiformis f. sp. tritici PST-130]|nr:hypothetical protein KEM48_004315 [Puccinia striiformis f. sp. tritici PST-130]